MEDMLNFEEEIYKISKAMKSYYKGKLKMKEVILLCDAIKDVYVKRLHSEDCPLEIGELRDNTGGSYCKNTNKIILNKSYIESIIEGKMNISDLFVTIGHELKHLRQNMAVKKYEKMSIEEQSLIDSVAKESIEAYNDYYTIRDVDVMALSRVLAPYLGEQKIPDGYDTLDDFCKDVSFAHYYTLLSEREARSEGYYFANFILKETYKKETEKKFMQDKSFIEKLDLEKEHINRDFAIEKYEETKQFDLINKYTKFKTVDIETLLKIVDEHEGMKKDEFGFSIHKLQKDYGVSYPVLLNIFLKEKSLEQKLELLKNAIKNDYTQLGIEVVESIEKGIDLKRDKKRISRFVLDCFEGVKVYNSTVVIIELDKILEEKSFKRIVNGCLLNDPVSASFLIDNASKIVYNLEDIKAFQDTLKTRELIINSEEREAEYEYYEEFFQKLYSKVDYDKKMDLLTNHPEEIEYKNQLIDSILKNEGKESYREKQ